MNKRNLSLDTLRFFACLLVFVNHFYANVDNGLYGSLWSSSPFSYVFEGINAKLGVAVFAVIAGYFAAASGSGERSRFLSYCFSRYFSFAFAEILGIAFMFACLAVSGTSVIDAVGFVPSVWFLFKEILGFGSTLVPILWCLKEFFIGSVFSFICGKYKIDVFPIGVIILILTLVGKIWTGVVIMGALAFSSLNTGFIKTALSGASVRTLLLIFFALIVILYPIENRYYHFAIGIASLLLFLFIQSSAKAKQCLSPKTILAKRITEKYFAFYIINESVYKYLAGKLLPVISPNVSFLSFTACFIICLGIVIIICFPVDFVLKKVSVVSKKTARLLSLDRLEEILN